MIPTKAPNIRSLILCLGFVMGLLPLSSKADSPITSTPFWEAYQDIEMIAYAQESGVIDKMIAKYLLSKKTPIQYKAAVVNALGWDFNGKENAEIFATYLAKKRKYDTFSPEYSLWRADDLMVYGYLRMMDNYFEPDVPIEILGYAAEKAPLNYTIRLIHALCQAQKHLDGNWCMVWKVVDKVNRLDDSTDRLRNEAKKIIMDYIKLYQDSC